MLLHKESRFPFFLSSPPKSPPPSLVSSFESSLASRLATLLHLPEDSASLSLHWLAFAVCILSETLSDAANLLADASSSDRDAIAGYLDRGVALLDLCNAASAEVDRLLRRRLNLRFALHLLSSSEGGRDSGKLDRALGSVAEWRAAPLRDIKSSALDLARSLSPAALPRRKISSVRRAIYAVEAVSALIASVLVAVLGGRALDVAAVPDDLPWAKKYKEVAGAVAKKLAGEGFAAEVVATESAVEKLTDVVEELKRWKENGDGHGENTDILVETVSMTEKLTDEMTKGLDELSSAVNDVFHSSLGLRSTALQGFRVGSQKCK